MGGTFSRIGLTGLSACLTLFLFCTMARGQSVCSFGGTPIYKGCFNVTYKGCCTIKQSAGGQVMTLQWCENGYLCSVICNPFNAQTQYCGWATDPQTGQGLYDCTVAPAEDPSGQFPLLCNIPCGDVSAEGCCEGNTLLKYCKNGSLQIINCEANSGELKFCGWNPVVRGYACTISPAEGPPGHPYQCGAAACTPDCSGKQCGDDGCGGLCGQCNNGQVCSNGTCVSTCQPDCKFKQCGPDGCGGTCGKCGEGFACNEEGQCVTKPCVPDCDNKECGSDLCGGTCGVCKPPRVCSAYFKCVMPDEDASTGLDTTAGGDSRDAGGGETAIGYDDGMVCAEGSVSKYGMCVPQSRHGTSDYDGGGGSSSCMAGYGPSNGSAAKWAPVLVVSLVFLVVLRLCRRRKRVKASSSKGT